MTPRSELLVFARGGVRIKTQEGVGRSAQGRVLCASELSQGYEEPAETAYFREERDDRLVSPIGRHEGVAQLNRGAGRGKVELEEDLGVEVGGNEGSSEKLSLFEAVE